MQGAGGFALPLMDSAGRMPSASGEFLSVNSLGKVKCVWGSDAGMPVPGMGIDSGCMTQ